MKDILISIRPQWVEKIASGKKTIEVRKTRPKLEMPFKCFVYCTKGVVGNNRHLHINEPRVRNTHGVTNRWFGGYDTKSINGGKFAYECYLADGKVIGEFICDRIDEYILILDYKGDNYATSKGWRNFPFNEACLSREEVVNYGDGKTLYGWHISDLKIYDKPKALYEFWLEDKCPYATIKGCTYKYRCFRAGEDNHKNGRCGKLLPRPPQSWCYVEGVK